MVALRLSQKPVILDARVLRGSGGGPDKTIINSPRYLDADGYRMLCVYMHDPDDPGFKILRTKAEAKGVELISVADRGPLDWRVVPQMVEICKRERVDVWHGHDYKSNALGLVLKRFWPMRLVTTVHGWVQHTAHSSLLPDRPTQPALLREGPLRVRRSVSVLPSSRRLRSQPLLGAREWHRSE